MRDKKQAVNRNSKKHFDRVASEYETSHAFSGPISQNELMFDRIRGIPFKSMLDIGCGTGILLSRILETRDIHVSGIDISTEMLRIAREKLGERAELVEGDSENLPFQDGQFDLVTSASMFHHLPDPASVLAEIGRVLAPGGTLVITDCCSVFPLRQLLNLLFKFTRSGDYHLYSESELITLTISTGFIDVSWEMTDKSWFFLTASSST